MIATAVAAGLAVYPVAELAVLARLVRLIGWFGAGLMAAAMLAGTAWVVSWAAVVLLVQYGLALVNAPALDPWAPAVGAGLFLMVESAYLSLERRERLTGRRGLVLPETARVAGLALAAVAVGALVLAAASLRVTDGIVVQIAGIGAVAAALAALVLLVRRRG